MGKSRVRFGPFVLDTIGSHTAQGSTGGGLTFSPFVSPQNSLITSYSPAAAPGRYPQWLKGRTVSAQKASATVRGTSALLGHNVVGVLTLTNTDGTTHTFRTNSALSYTASTSTDIGTLDTNTESLATYSIYNAFLEAITAGALKMTLSPSTVGSIDFTNFTVTQTDEGTAGNSVISVIADNIIIKVQDKIDTLAAVGIIGGPQILNDNLSLFRLVNTAGGNIDFNTDNTKTELTSTATNIGTLNVNTIQKANASIHRSVSLAIGLGAPLSIVPTVYTTEGSVTVRQTVAGSIGNTAITFPSGVKIVNYAYRGVQSSVNLYADATLRNQHNTQLILTDTAGISYTLTTDNTVAYNASTSIKIGTLNIASEYEAMYSLYLALTQIIAPFSVVTPRPVNGRLARYITVKQDIRGVAGNTSVTTPNTGGVYVFDKAGARAAATLRGDAVLLGTNGTTLTFSTISGAPYVFTTNNLLSYTASTATEIGTLDTDTNTKANLSIHNALTAAVNIYAILFDLQYSSGGFGASVDDLIGVRRRQTGSVGNTLISPPPGAGGGIGVNGLAIGTPASCAGGSNPLAGAFSGGLDPVSSSFSGGSDAPLAYFSGGVDREIDLFMDGLPVSGVSTVSKTDGSVDINMAEDHYSLLAFNRLVFSAVEADNGDDAAPGDMSTITVYGLFGSNYKDPDSRNQPTSFSGPGPYVQGGFQQITLGTLTRASPTLVWDDRMKTTTTVGSDTSEAAKPFLTGIRLYFTPSATGVIRVYVDAERDF
jgi:hypothetical protein